MDAIAAWRGKTVLVTGGNGFIGRHVLEAGRRHGIKLMNLSLNAAAPAGVEHYQADIGDRQVVADIFSRNPPAAVLHLAASGVAHGSGKLADALSNNVQKLEGLLDIAAGASQRPAFVIAGSGFEYGRSEAPHAETEAMNPFTPYGISKAGATLLCGMYADAMPITVLRLFSVYGPGEPLARLAPYVIDRVLSGQPVELTGCKQLRDYTYVADVAEAFWRAASLPPLDGALRIVNIASGVAITLREFVECLGRLLAERGYRPDLRFGAKAYRSEEPMAYLAETGRMRDLLDWQPDTGLEEGLQCMIEEAVAA